MIIVGVAGCRAVEENVPGPGRGSQKSLGMKYHGARLTFGWFGKSEVCVRVCVRVYVCFTLEEKPVLRINHLI